MAQSTLVDVAMPRLSDSMEEGTILSWLKQVGDRVAVGEELVEVETDKANMAYESDVAGTLAEIIAGEGETLSIGATIARVEGAGTGSGAGSGSSSGGSTAAQGPAPEASSQAQPASRSRHSSAAAAPVTSRDAGENGGRAKASPLARRIARDRGVDLSRLQGTGPGGRIVKVDVERAEPGSAEPATATSSAGAAASEDGPATAPGTAETAKGTVEVVEPSKLQATVARRMSESKSTVPHFYLQTEIDMTAAVAARARLKGLAAEGEPVPSYNDMAVKACALALREFPRANGAYRESRWELYSRVNVGIAVAAPEALVVPTIFDADRKGLREIAADARRVASRVKEGKITPPELSGATFTVSNLGMYGITSFQAVINPPQAAILAVGSIEERPVVRDGELVAAHLMNATLACDHRILNGAEGAQFLARVRALLEEPISLAL